MIQEQGHHLWHSSLLIFYPWYFSFSFLLGWENSDELLRKECWAFSVALAVGKRSKKAASTVDICGKSALCWYALFVSGCYFPDSTKALLSSSLNKLAKEKSKKYCCWDKLISPNVSRTFWSSPNPYLAMVSESTDAAFLWDLHLNFY